MATIDGATLLARNLKKQGVDYMFGIVGFPVVPIARAAQAEGITYIGMRNEQAASYATQAAGYMTGRTQACLVVSGPGVIHALAGLANAKENCWPMLLIGGASDSKQNGMAAFQEEAQVQAASPYCKYSHAVEDPSRIPYYVEQAIRTSLFGRPGSAYLDMPDDVIQGQIEESEVVEAGTVGEPPRTLAPTEQIEAALDAMKSAEKPLVIVGKGMAWSRAEDEVRDFIDRTKLPFLASPMGKGVVSDDHPLSVGAARSHALAEADVIFLAGARLNWIMHFGKPPRFREDVRIVQLDLSAEQIGHNVPAEVGLVGDGKAVFGQLNAALEANPWAYAPETNWRASIADKITANAAAIQPMIEDDSAPTNYFRAFKDIREWAGEDAIIASEGANTMDIGRTQLPNFHARHRLDAGSYGTMGVGLGFAIAAAVTNPDKKVVCVEGDSAFGFSGMEMETAARHQLPITFIVLNNGGIGGGFGNLDPAKPKPVNALMWEGARYEKVAEAFGANGYFVQDPADLRAALDAAEAAPGPSLVHVVLNPKADRKPQKYGWHS